MNGELDEETAEHTGNMIVLRLVLCAVLALLGLPHASYGGKTVQVQKKLLIKATLRLCLKSYFSITFLFANCPFLPDLAMT